MRETSQLQAQWRGTKMKAKAENSANKRSVKATGGGPPPKSPDQDQRDLMALIPHEFEEDQNQYDCDTEMAKENLPSTSKNATALNEEEFEDILFLEDEWPRMYAPSPPSPSPLQPPPPLRSSPPLDSSKKKSKINYEDAELLKKELFNAAMENRRAEKTFMQLEHDEKMKPVLMERNEKMETLRMERKHKEIHQLKMRRLEEED